MIDDNWVMHAHVVSYDEFSEGMSHTVPTIHHNFVNSIRPFISWKEDEVMVQEADWQVDTPPSSLCDPKGFKELDLRKWLETWCRSQLLALKGVEGSCWKLRD